MPIIAKEDGSPIEPVPEDNYVARCTLVCDIGTQESDFGPKRQVVLGFELPDQMRVFDEAVGEEPVVISKYYTLSLGEKSNLRRDLQGWRGQAFTADELAGFDLERLLGAPCLLTVVHKTNGAGNKRAVIAGIAKLPRGLECPAAILPRRVFSIDDRDVTALELMPEWIREQVKKSAEWRELESAGDPPESTNNNVHSDYPEDNIPF